MGCTASGDGTEVGYDDDDEGGADAAAAGVGTESWGRWWGEVSVLLAEVLDGRSV